MISIEILEKTTNEFFDKFCNDDLFNSRPIWSSKWMFRGEVPNNSKKGCYALLYKDEIVYIGVAIGDSYEGSGLGSRISNYWKYDSNENGVRTYEPTVKGINSIITLPFTPNDFYLAAALEVYLIQKLNPPNNKTHSRKI